MNPLDIKQESQYSIHHILANSYLVYLILFLVGVSLDLYFHLNILKDSIGTPLGILILLVGTLLIVWAQKTSRNLKKENLSKESFYKGPYRLTRGPTHLGLFFLVIGFAIIVNALFILILAIFSYFFTKYTSLKKQEDALEIKYGAPYREYKQMVKF